MALTDPQIQAVKNWLGYGSMTALALPYLEYAPVFEAVVQNNLNPVGETLITGTILPNLTQLDTDIMTFRNRYGIKELVGDVVFDTSPEGRQHTQLLELRRYWLKRLSETVRIPIAQSLNSTVSDVY